MQPALSPPKPRASRACILCHKKKIRCDVNVSRPCSNCRAYNYECRPRERKRRRYTLSISPRSESPNHGRELEKHALPLSLHPTLQERTRLPDGVTLTARSQIELSQNIPTAHDEQSKESDETCTPYLGRSEYLEGNLRINEEVARKYEVQAEKGGAIDRVLELHHAFDMPPRVVRNSLIDCYMNICHPWMPIVDRSDFEERQDHKPSILLLQAVLVAGSRMSSAPHEHTPCEELYRRAKSLFYSQHERNTLTVVRALCLMQWYNPTGPEHISVDKASFWLRTGVGLAYDIGLHREPDTGPESSLRRRLWWTLYARDCLISAGQGRPRAINPEDSNVRPISVDDFPEPDKKAHLFVAHVRICSILGDLAECCVRNNLSHSKRAVIERDLAGWARDLPPHLHMHRQDSTKGPALYDLEIWQLHVPYFTALTILYRPMSKSGVLSPIALLSSSFIVGIVENFLVRDDLRNLNSIFTFHLLVASFPQLSCHRCSAFRQSAEEELHIIKLALQELGKKWGSALGPLKIIQTFADETTTEPLAAVFPCPRMTPDQLKFFEPYGPEFCRKWDLIVRSSNQEILNVEIGTQGDRSTGVLAVEGSADPFSYEALEEDQFPFDLARYNLFQSWDSIDFN